MSRKSSLSVMALSVTVSLLLALPTALLLGQNEEPDPAATTPDIFLEQIQVNIVNVDVVVTDNDGRPVTNLSADDFEVFEDGEPMEITNFFAIDRRQKVASSPADEGTQPAPEPTESEEEPASTLPPEEQRLHVVIYIDNANIRPFNRRQAFNQLRTFLREYLNADDRVMLVSFERSLHIRHHFDEPVVELVDKLQELEQEAPGGLNAEAELRRILVAMQLTSPNRPSQEAGFSQVPAGAELAALTAQIRAYAQRRYDETAFTLDVLERFINSLSGLPGRKAVLYVSDGLPLRPAEAVVRAWENRYLTGDEINAVSASGQLFDTGEFDTGTRFNELAAQANAGRVTFYTINAAGSDAFSPADAAQPGISRDLNSPLFQSMYWGDLRRSLQLMADATGGRLLDNGPGLDERLWQLTRELDVYYSLGYNPPHYGDGRDHEIRVKVARPGLHLRYRESYRDKTLADQGADKALSAVLLGVSHNPLEVELSFGEQTLHKDGNYLVEVMITFPMNKLLLVPRGKEHHGRLSLFVVARDTKGRLSPVSRHPVPIAIPNEQLAQALTQTAGYRFQMALRTGSQKVAVGLWDQLASTNSAVSAEVMVGEDTAANASRRGTARP